MLQSIDPFQDISPLATTYNESESFLPATIDQFSDEFRDVVNVPFDEENSEWEESEDEDGVDFGRSAFDDIIFDGDGDD